MSARFPRMLWPGLFSALVVLCPSFATSVPAAGKDGKGSKAVAVSPAVIAAWKKAGAEFGYAQDDLSDVMMLVTPWETRNGLPAFGFRSRPKVALTALPVPPVPFGINFGFAGVTDSDLKGVARFKNLRALGLAYAKVTDKCLAS